MLYAAYQTHADIMVPVRILGFGRARRAGALGQQRRPEASAQPDGGLRADRARRPDARAPALRHNSVQVGNREVAVTEEAVASTPFGTLLQFQEGHGDRPAARAGGGAAIGPFRHSVAQPGADPAAGARRLHNRLAQCPRCGHRTHGRFGFDDYVDHLIQWLEKMGPGTHVVAVCQPCVQVLAAAAVMAEAKQPGPAAQHDPDGGARSTRASTRPRSTSWPCRKPIEWFEKNLIAEVPSRYPGGGRKVYPGFVQLAAFMSMNIDRHRKAHLELYENLAKGEMEKAQVTKDFYDEYFAVLDLTAEFYLETVQWVFQEARLAKGELTYRGRPVDPKRHPAHGAADRGRRARRHLRDRPDLGGARPVQGPQALHEAPPHAGRRRPLRRVQRQALGDRSTRSCAT